MRRLVFLAALLLAAPLLAAEIRQITPPAGQSQAVLQAPSARGTWRIVADDSLAEVQPQLVADASLAILQGGPGRYQVRWRAGPLKPWQATIVDLGAVVPPKPDDPPTPTPIPPVPVPSAVKFVVIVCEASEPAEDVAIGAIRLSAVTGEIASWAKSNGVSVRVVDKDVVNADGKVPAKLAPFLKEAQGRALPWVVATGAPDQTGASPLVLSERCPATVDGVLKILGAAK